MKRSELDALKARITEQQTERTTALDRLSAAAQRVAAIQANALYALLPKWIKSKIESILGN